MRYMIGILLSITTICMSGCGDKLTDLTWVSIDETQCDNGWDDLGLASTEANVTQYLKNNEIDIYDFRIDVYSFGPACLACTCASGRTVRVQIEGKDLADIKALGFSED